MTLKDTRALARSLPGSDKDFRLKLSVSNNQLRSRRIALGLTVEELLRAAKIDTSPQNYSRLENARGKGGAAVSVCRIPDCRQRANRSKSYICAEHREEYGDDPEGWPSLEFWPIKRAWKPLVLRLAKFYGCAPDDLVPPSVRALKKRSVEMEVSTKEVRHVIETISMSDARKLPAVESPLGDDIGRPTIDSVLSTVTAREEEVLRERFGIDDGREKTLAEIGKNLNGISVERVRQIEARALWKLRHPSRSKRLRHLIMEQARPCWFEKCRLTGGYPCDSGTPFCWRHRRGIAECPCILCKTVTGRDAIEAAP